MESSSRQDITKLLRAWRDGDDGAFEELVPLVYDELRRLARAQMRHEPAEHTLQPTGLVHEAYARVGGGPAEAAGLRVGERIVAVDGVGFEDSSLSAVRETWRRAAPGTAVLLRVRSGDETREVRIVLRDLY